MTNKTKQAILDSIAHHLRMQEWVKKQDQSTRLDIFPEAQMLDEIEENWRDAYCALCILFDGCCKKCPLGKKYGKCSNGTQNEWVNLAYAKTWKEWLKADRKLVKQLKSLLED